MKKNTPIETQNTTSIHYKKNIDWIEKLNYADKRPDDPNKEGKVYEYEYYIALPIAEVINTKKITELNLMDQGPFDTMKNSCNDRKNILFIKNNNNGAHEEVYLYDANIVNCGIKKCGKIKKQKDLLSLISNNTCCTFEKFQDDNKLLKYVLDSYICKKTRGIASGETKKELTQQERNVINNEHTKMTQAIKLTHNNHLQPTAHHILEADEVIVPMILYLQSHFTSLKELNIDKSQDKIHRLYEEYCSLYKTITHYDNNTNTAGWIYWNPGNLFIGPKEVTRIYNDGSKYDGNSCGQLKNFETLSINKKIKMSTEPQRRWKMILEYAKQCNTPTLVSEIEKKDKITVKKFQNFRSDAKKFTKTVKKAWDKEVKNFLNLWIALLKKFIKSSKGFTKSSKGYMIGSVNLIYPYLNLKKTYNPQDKQPIQFDTPFILDYMGENMIDKKTHIYKEIRLIIEEIVRRTKKRIAQREENEKSRKKRQNKRRIGETSDEQKVRENWEQNKKRKQSSPWPIL